MLWKKYDIEKIDNELAVLGGTTADSEDNFCNEMGKFSTGEF